MKKIFIGIAGLVLFLLFHGCSGNTEPRIRIKNEQSKKVEVKIQTPGSTKFTINEVEAEQTTEYEQVALGNITVTVVVQNESVSFLAMKSTQYTIIISEDKPPELHID